jgi:Mor family transcriptional regulator
MDFIRGSGEWLELDTIAIFRDRRHGHSLGQLARAYRVSRTTIHRVLHEHASTTPENPA